MAQTFPASRDTVENKADAKANPKPDQGKQKLDPDLSPGGLQHWGRRPGRELDSTDWRKQNPLLWSLAFQEENGQLKACRKSVRNLPGHNCRGAARSASDGGATIPIVLRFCRPQVVVPRLSPKRSQFSEACYAYW